MSDASERMAAEAEYFSQREIFRESVHDQLDDLREDIARMLARLSAERGQEGERFWEAVSFEDWWNDLGLTERLREEYRAQADRFIEMLKAGIR